MSFRYEDYYSTYINLEKRPDRNRKMQLELERVGLSAERFNALTPLDYVGRLSDVFVMATRTIGAIGCHISHEAVLKKSLEHDKNTFIMEDDIVFCTDIKERLNIIQYFTDTHEWDMVFLSGTYHTKPAYWHTLPHNKDMMICSCKNGKDVEATDSKYLVRTYGCFCTCGYLVNKNSISKILELISKYSHLSMGLDWLYMYLQPQLKCYAFVPGCVKQYDDKSDIGAGVTRFSGFAKLGDYWFQDKMNGFNYEKYKSLLC